MILGGKLPGKVGRCRFLWLHGQAVKTPPFHGGNPGSIPGGVTNMRKWLSGRASPCQGEGREFESRLPLQRKTVKCDSLFSLCFNDSIRTKKSTCGPIDMGSVSGALCFWDSTAQR